ncbi:MAG: rod shape-determining protein MreC [Brevundimonas sp.]|uniref:rod shape-determining protein MreC n=1 Tax=Brevundimonas sp. TaxID=1871086 RepID=UPI00258F7BF6|nr:rod shape-determining protein MreC [Brevundimonas sp.]MCV0413531.1 rod shape-determining protein MreC [Brevundimonas sp.]
MAFRDGPFENLKVPLTWTAAVVVVVAIVGAILLLATDRRSDDGVSAYGALRSGTEAVAAPAGGVLSAPVRWVGAVGDYIGGYFFAVSENRRLKAEIADLRAWRDEAIALKNVNGRYEAMMGLRTEPPMPMVTARAISDVRGPFARARLLDAGQAKGVRIGNPVMNEFGLAGRVTGVTGGVSRMVLLTDVASRVPVLIERTDTRAMLVGDGGENPRLDYVRGAGALQPGDRVLSSGDGGGVPRGLPVGVVARGVDGAWRVKLFSDRGPIDYVRILLFQNFAQLVSPEALNAPPLAGLTTAPEPTPEQAAQIADVAARRRAEAEAQAERTRLAVAQAEQAERLRAAQQAQAQAQTQAQPQGQPRTNAPAPTQGRTARPVAAETRPSTGQPRPQAQAQGQAQTPPQAAPAAAAPARPDAEDET